MNINNRTGHNISTKFDIEEGIIYLGLSRPDKLNAFSSSMIEEIHYCIKNQVPQDAKGMIIYGSGRAFSSGADIQEWFTREGGKLDPGKAKATAALGFDAMRELKRFPFPVISVVHGFCLGGGFQLALYSDTIIATEYAKLGFPEIKYGLIPGAGGSIYSSLKAGRATAFEILTEARDHARYEGMPANDAKDKGLVEIVCDDFESGMSIAKSLIDSGKLMKARYGLDLGPLLSVNHEGRMDGYFAKLINSTYYYNETEASQLELDMFLELLSDIERNGRFLGERQIGGERHGL